MIKSIIFDLGGVVISNRIRNYVHHTTANYYNVSVEKIKRAMGKNKNLLDIYNWDEDKYWSSIVDDLEILDPPPLRHIWTEKYKEMTPPNRKVIGLIKKLKSNKYKLAVLSNTIEPHASTNRKRRLFDLFDIVVLSCDPKINSKKPDKKIYEVCLNKIRSLPEQCVFIDDDKTYLKPAKELGIHTIFYQNFNKLKKELKKLDVNF